MDRTIIVDLDGTLCDASARAVHLQKTPKDWQAFYTNLEADQIFEGAQWIVQKALTDGFTVLYVTGRDEEYRSQTENWLQRHELLRPNTRLYMRPAGDRTDDVVVKTRLYRDQIKDQYAILFVLEDRQSIVDMWRSFGLACYQVAPGNF